MTLPISYKSNWGKYVFRRVLLVIVVFVFMSVAIFLVDKFEAPNINDPFAVSWDELQWMEAEYLGDSLPVQYIRWLGDFFTGDWGISLYSY